MYKSRTKERRMFTSRKRSRPRYSILSAIASIALVFLILELFTRIFIDLSGNENQFARANTESDITQAYKLKFVHDLAEQDSTSSSSDLNLKAKPSLSVGYQLLGNQKNEHWQINPQGFRDRDPLPQAKPKDEIRIFLLGGSTAFGYGSPDDTGTISQYLEQRLQERMQQQKASPNLYRPNLLPSDPVEKQKYLAKPAKIQPGNYRVVNAAVPGYTSGNELAQLALQILKYKPDLIVVLDGYEDLMLKSDQEAIQSPKLTLDKQTQPTSFVDYASRLIEPIENKSYLAKMAQDRWLKNKQANQKQDFILNEKAPNLVQYLPQNQDELQKRVNRYIDHQKQILSLSAAAQVPVVVAMQPEITGRNPTQLTDIEGKIATDLGRSYIKQMKDSYPVLIEAIEQLAKNYPKNLKAVDSYQHTDKYPSPSFIDPIHLNEAANEQLAQQLYYAIASLPKMQVVPTQAPPSKPTYQESSNVRY
jgi:lysophospholipase L1-like esterase